MKPILAIAGGTGAFGRTVVAEALKLTTWDVVVLGRKAPDSYPYKFASVDYNDIPSMVKTLKEIKAHTIISTINVQNEETCVAQVNLIKAADQCEHTKRFIPSEYGIHIKKDVLTVYPEAQYFLDTEEALKATTHMQYTRFCVGFFMDYWGIPHLPSTLWPYTWAVDIENCTAAVPGTGDEPLTLTYSIDAARIIAATVDSVFWPKQTIVCGDTTTFNHIIKLAEEVRGKKFKVTYDSEEKLKRHDATLLTSKYGGGEGVSVEEAKRMVSIFGLLAVNGFMQVPLENRVQDEKFTNLKLMTVERMIRECWTRK